MYISKLQFSTLSNVFPRQNYSQICIKLYRSESFPPTFFKYVFFERASLTKQSQIYDFLFLTRGLFVLLLDLITLLDYSQSQIYSNWFESKKETKQLCLFSAMLIFIKWSWFLTVSNFSDVLFPSLKSFCTSNIICMKA